MSFAFAGDGALDYSPCRYGASKLLFRGPARALTGPYCAVLGGTETYGKFVPRPFPDLAEGLMGRAMVNLGCLNAGPDVFLNDAEVMRIASAADVTVVQIFGAANLTNRLYTVHPRRNDRFLRASSWLRTLYRDVDFTDFHFTRHLLGNLYQASPARFEVVAGELRAAWIARMRALLARIGGRTVLLWMADHPPVEERDATDLLRDPLLVTAEMVAAVRPHASAYVEAVASPAARAEGLADKVFSPLERPAAEGVPGAIAHREAAEALVEVIRLLPPK